MNALLATDTVAVGVTVIATLVLVALAAAVWYLLKAVRDLRQEASGLAREAGDMLGELDMTVHQAGLEVERVDRMVGSAEAISDAVGSASRLVGGAVTTPFIKVVAFSSGVARGLRLIGGHRGTDQAERARGSRRRKKSRARYAGRWRGRPAPPVRSAAALRAGEGRRH